MGHSDVKVIIIVVKLLVIQVDALVSAVCTYTVGRYSLPDCCEYEDE